AVLIDGYRTNDNIYDQGSLGTEFALDIDLIERVEFVPGPSSSIYGANALFGVINIITRRARDIGGVETAAAAASYRTGYGRVSLGRELDSGVSLVLSASHYESRGPNLFFPEFASSATRNGMA